MPVDENAKSQDRLLFYLKTRGPQSATELGARLGMTRMGARQHLLRLFEEGLVYSETEKRPRGRPSQVWRLTEAAARRFPEGYADLAVGLLENVREVFGKRGVEKLIDARLREQTAAYHGKISRSSPLGRRVAALARLRTEEGYLAESAKQKDGSYLLIENHCPICAAAELCQGLCSGELELFRAALGDDATVERSEHLLSGDRRCVYRITMR